MKKLMALVTFVVLMGLSVMVVHADVGQPIEPETRWVTATRMLNVRWEPSMEAGIRTVVRRYERVVVDRRFGSGDLAWYHMRLVSDVDFITGWVLGRYLGPLGDHVPPAPLRPFDDQAPPPTAPVAPVTPAVPAPPVLSADDSVMRVTADFLNIRSTPTSRAEYNNVIGTLRRDTWVVVNTTDRQRVHGTGELAWLYVRVVDGTASGWVFSGFLSIS